VKLLLLKEAARTGMFESEAAIRSMIQRGALLRGVHWFQERRRGRIRIDIDAVVEKFTRHPVESPPEKIRLLRGSFAAKKAS
jgi:hypothetical protein